LKSHVRMYGGVSKKNSSDSINSLPSSSSNRLQGNISDVWLPKNVFSTMWRNLDGSLWHIVRTTTVDLPNTMIKYTREFMLANKIKGLRQIASEGRSKDEGSRVQSSSIPKTVSKVKELASSQSKTVVIKGDEHISNDDRTNITSVEKLVSDESSSGTISTKTSDSVRTLTKFVLNTIPLKFMWPNLWRASAAGGVVGSAVTDPSQIPAAAVEDERVAAQENLSVSASIDHRTKHLVSAIGNATSNETRLIRLNQFCTHLMQYPRAKATALRSGIVAHLLKIRHQWNTDGEVKGYVNEALALVGYIEPLRGHGVRVLAIDGGGIRGVIAIEVLRQLEEMTGQPAHQLFDYMCGVSTGCLITLLIGALKKSAHECSRLYKQVGIQIFEQNSFLGTSNLVLTHAYYNTDTYEKILKEVLGDLPLIQTTRDPTMPKIASISTLMNLPELQAFLIRNYDYPPHAFSRYKGTYKPELWEAMRASGAAPGYFEEYKIDGYVLQDGGLLMNNPTAVGIHESRQLWAGASLQCVLSLGTGRNPMSDTPVSSDFTSLKTKLTRVMDSATDTETMHTAMYDLLPPSVYFRFNPHLTGHVTLDETRTEKLEQLERETRVYLKSNSEKLKKLANKLVEPRSTVQRVGDGVRSRLDMFL